MTIYNYIALVCLWLTRNYKELNDVLIFAKNYYFQHGASAMVQTRIFHYTTSRTFCQVKNCTKIFLF